MDEPKSLDRLFEKKIFRIPDYQRGYAWQKSQLNDFWSDLINLSDDRSHYTGVLTLKEASPNEVTKNDKEYWLVDDHSYKMYQIVDGQQRLTTFVVFLQAYIDFMKTLDENKGKSDQEVFITDSLTLEDVISKYLYKTKPNGELYRTYKFGYMADNPSYKYLRHEIFNEDGSPSIKNTFYTLNLLNAKRYFCKQLKEFNFEFGMDELQKIYKKLTKNFLFNEYVIKNEFDVFVAFETMNNRGKRLSDLELLKNRLIYLTTLYQLDNAEHQSLRENINDAWKEVYYQLGRNDKRPLNDDDFLKAHWTMYFQYSRNKGNDYIKFLLDDQFSPHKIFEKVEHIVDDLEIPEEYPIDFEIDDSDSDDGGAQPDGEMKNRLLPSEIKNYVNSLQASVVHWFNSHYPHLAEELSDAEKDALDRLNRIGMRYFRPLIVSVFKNEENSKERVNLFNHIERFIFIAFHLSQMRSNYKDSEFYNASRELNMGKLTLEGINKKLDAAITFCIDEDKTLNSVYFYNHLNKLFSSNKKEGYYSWGGLRYFLYEYELQLHSQSRQKKVAWDDLFKKPRDKVSIEHVFPQKPTGGWKNSFETVDEKDYPLYSGSIGNLLLLSMSINSSLQNHSFGEKKRPKYNDANEKIRNGYSDGSHSEIEVAQQEEWTPAQIEGRGLRLLSFMEDRWDIKFANDKVKADLLFLDEKSEEAKVT